MIVNDNIASVTSLNISYDDLVGSAEEGIFISTVDGSYMMVNKALAEIYGYESPEELIMSVRNIADQLYVDPGMRDRFKNEMSRRKKVRNFEAEIRTKDGEHKWIHESVRSVYDDSGIFLYYEGFVTDITELKQNREKIIHQNKELSELNKTLEIKVKERTRKLKEQKLVIQDQKDELIELLKEKNRGRITRRATFIALGVVVVLCLIFEAIMIPLEQQGQVFPLYLHIAALITIILMLVPIEWVVTKLMFYLIDRKYSTPQ